MIKRVKDFELRRSYPLNRTESDKGYLEIVKWEGETCYTLLQYKNTKEGPDIRFVGNRPFKVQDQDLLWYLMEFGQTIGEAEFELDYRTKDSYE
jgi:hypothetical protein